MVAAYGHLARVGMFFAGTFINRIKSMWLMIGLGGTLGAAWLMGGQVLAGFNYTPAVATIEWTGYVCQPASRKGPMTACSEAETIRRAAIGSPLTFEFHVRFSFTNPQKTERHTITGRLPMTGLPREEAEKGRQFNLLYDPASPRKTSLPPGSDYNAVLIGLVGLAALGSYAAIFWMNGAVGRRRRELKLDALTEDVMSRFRA